MKKFTLFMLVLAGAGCMQTREVGNFSDGGAGHLGSGGSGGSGGTGGMAGTGGMGGTGGTGGTGGAQAATVISAGTYHSCAVTSTGGVKCWGANSTGELGDGTTMERHTPVDVVGLSAGVSSVVAAFGYSCALMTSGAVKCWGGNGSGSLGDGTTADRHTPVDVSGLSGAIAIAAGGGHTCAVLSGGGLSCWGRNDYGQVGDGSIGSDRWWPRSVSIAGGVAAVTAGAQHTCAITATGGAKCWGYNGDGELGVGDTNGPYTTPVDVRGLTSGVIAIEAGYNHNCAITSSGLECWGYNFQGQLGDGTMTNRLTPVVAGLSTLPMRVAAGTDRTCVVLGGGGVECWGFNLSGGVGDGTTMDRWSPVGVVGLASGMAAVATGEDHSCAMTASRRVKCWGSNGGGKLG